MTLQSVARLAKLAFSGTVNSIAFRRIDGEVVTDVHFSQVRSVGPGQHGDVTLTLLGGIMDGEEVGIVGMPRFEEGKRYIILAADRGSAGNSFLPLVGLTEGVFSVVSHATHGRVVLDSAGRPIVGINGNHIAVVSRGHASGEKARGRIPRVEKIYGIGVAGVDIQEPAKEIYPSELDPGTRVTEDEFLRVVERLREAK